MMLLYKKKSFRRMRAVCLSLRIRACAVSSGATLSRTSTSVNYCISYLFLNITNFGIPPIDRLIFRRFLLLRLLSNAREKTHRLRPAV